MMAMCRNPNSPQAEGFKSVFLCLSPVLMLCHGYRCCLEGGVWPGDHSLCHSPGLCFWKGSALRVGTSLSPAPPGKEFNLAWSAL